MTVVSHGRFRRLAGAAALTAALVALPAPAHAAAQVHRAYCAPVTATGAGQDLGGGHTEATLQVGSTVVATSAATFTTTRVDGTVASFTGPIVLTPVIDVGTLTAEVQGTFDTSTGAFTATSTSVTGTRALRHVTGSLTFTGEEDLTTFAFTEQVSGQLCVG